MYNKYKRYGYKPIDDGIKSTHGCMLSKVSSEELEVINLVIDTFGLYSPKTLELISHSQDPWKEMRLGYKADASCTEIIKESSVKEYYLKLDLNSKEIIINYIIDCVNMEKNCIA